tara:strand:+ start:217 stop:522 length:306 start_codon:yes stop_codon:yes gene_type:complete
MRTISLRSAQDFAEISANFKSDVVDRLSKFLNGEVVEEIEELDDDIDKGGGGETKDEREEEGEAKNEDPQPTITFKKKLGALERKFVHAMARNLGLTSESR